MNDEGPRRVRLGHGVEVREETVPVDLAHEQAAHADAIQVVAGGASLAAARAHILVELGQGEEQIADVAKGAQALRIVEHKVEARVMHEAAEVFAQHAHEYGAVEHACASGGAGTGSCCCSSRWSRIVVVGEVAELEGAAVGVVVELVVVLHAVEAELAVLADEDGAQLVDDRVEEQRHGAVAQLVAVQVHVVLVDDAGVEGMRRLGVGVGVELALGLVVAELVHELAYGVGLARAAEAERVNGRMEHTVAAHEQIEEQAELRLAELHLIVQLFQFALHSSSSPSSSSKTASFKLRLRRPKTNDEETELNVQLVVRRRRL